MPSKFFISCALFLGAALGQFSSTPLYTIPFQQNGTDHNYTLQYQVLNVTGSNPMLYGVLSVTGINTSSWVAGQNGIWMGIGYGSKDMSHTDFNMLIYNFNNTTSD